MNFSFENLLQDLQDIQETDLVQRRQKIISLIRNLYALQQRISPSQIFEEIWGLEALDEEQLWGVLTLVNEEIMNFSTREIARRKDQGEEKEGLEEGLDDEEMESEIEEEEMENEIEEDEDEETKNEIEDHQNTDQNADQNSDLNSDEHDLSDLDLDLNSDSNEDDSHAKFSDFFSESQIPPPFSQSESEEPLQLNLDSDSESESSFPLSEAATSSSTFERQQAKLASEIAQLENENVAGEKPWTLRGEIQAASRPLDSLLQVDLEFENASKPIPQITQEHCDSIESMIIQRIKDGLFDDPQPLAAQTPQSNTSSQSDIIASMELQTQKSKQSLAEIYESERHTTQASSSQSSHNERHQQIKDLFNRLSSKLDSLCNYHYLPKVMPTQEISIISHAPAVTLEEAIPASVSNATLLAPHEIHPTAKKMPVAYCEQSKSQKRLIAKKSAQRKRQHNARITHGQSEKQQALKQLSKQRNVTLGGGAGTNRRQTKRMKK